jgi:hypothetical protein
LVVLPPGQCGFNILLLALFGPTGDENDKAISVFAKIDALAGPQVDSVFVKAGANAFGVGEIALLQTRQGRYFSRGLTVEAAEPLGVWGAASPIKIFTNFDHVLHGNTYDTN